MQCHKPVTDLASDRVEQLRSICANFPADKLVALPVARFEQFLDLIDAVEVVTKQCAQLTALGQRPDFLASIMDMGVVARSLR